MKTHSSLLSLSIFILLLVSSQAILHQDAHQKKSQNVLQQTGPNKNSVEWQIQYLQSYIQHLQGTLSNLQGIRSDDSYIDEIVDDTFSTVDRDSDGQLTWAEYQLAVYGAVKEGDTDYPEYKQIHEEFQRQDTDNSGTLNWTEVRAAVVVQLDQSIASIIDGIAKINQTIEGLQQQKQKEVSSNTPQSTASSLIQEESQESLSHSSDDSSESEESESSSDESSEESSDEDLLLIQKHQDTMAKLDSKIRYLPTFLTFSRKLNSTHRKSRL